jgi:hypothetical protein
MPLFLQLLTLVIALISIWKGKVEDYNDDRILLSRVSLSILTMVATFLSIIMQSDESAKAEKEKEAVHFRDSSIIATQDTTIITLKRQSDTTNFIKHVSDSILFNANATFSNMMNNFSVVLKNQQNTTTEVVKTHNLLGDKIHIRQMAFLLYNDSIYHLIDSLTRKGSIRFPSFATLPVYRYRDTSNIYNNINNFFLTSLQGLEVDIHVKDNSLEHYAAKGVLRLSEINKSYTAPYSSISPHHEKKCCLFVLQNADFDCYYKSPDFTSTIDFEHKKMYVSFAFFTEDLKDATPRYYSKIKLIYLDLSTDLRHHAEFLNSNESNDYLYVTNFQWTTKK